MALRMNLYGWKLQELIDAIGSKNATLLEKASAHFEEMFQGWSDQTDLPEARAWLRTLIYEGHALRKDREPPSVGTDGALVVVHVEAAVRIAVINSLVRALRREEFVNPASDAWKHRWGHADCVCMGLGIGVAAEADPASLR
jgi:hypothetical protein